MLLSFQPEERACLSVDLRLEAFIIKDSFSLKWTSEDGLVNNIESIVEEYRSTRQLLVRPESKFFDRIGRWSLEWTFFKKLAIIPYSAVSQASVFIWSGVDWTVALNLNISDILKNVLFLLFVTVASQNLSVWASSSGENYSCGEAVSTL